MKDTGGSSLANVAVVAALAFIAAIAFAWPAQTHKTKPVVEALADSASHASLRIEAQRETKPADAQETTGSANIVPIRLGDGDRRIVRRPKRDCAED